MKINIDLDYALDDLSDKKRLQLIKFLIDSAPDAYDFREKVKKYFVSYKFTENLD